MRLRLEIYPPHTQEVVFETPFLNFLKYSPTKVSFVNEYIQTLLLPKEAPWYSINFFRQIWPLYIFQALLYMLAVKWACVIFKQFYVMGTDMNNLTNHIRCRLPSVLTQHPPHPLHPTPPFLSLNLNTEVITIWLKEYW